LTGNGEGSLYGGANRNSGEAHEANDRYQRINATGNYAYPYEFRDSGFNIPYAIFSFWDPYGGRLSSSPTVSIKMPPNFNVTGFSDYARTENIFAVNGETYNGIYNNAMAMKQQEAGASATDNVQRRSIADQVAQVGLSAADAAIYSWKRSMANVIGWAGSAGLSNINQFEFMNRQAVNPQAQMLYRGPQMRRYQLPFTLHPKSIEDSEQINKIMNIFRVASSPSVPDTSGIAVGSLNIGVGNAFTFGYPHLTQFDVYFIDEDNQIQILFRSKLCVIESVATDYGGQKMTFYRDGTPTDIAMTLQLTEITPRTLGDAYTESDAQAKML
jgi:hypothetical protein